MRMVSWWTLATSHNEPVVHHEWCCLVEIEIKDHRATHYALALWQALHRQWPQILHRQMATKGPELQSEQRHVRMLPLVACTMAKTCPEHWLAMVGSRF